MAVCGGLHCVGCLGGMAVPVVPALEVYGFVWVVEHLVEVIATSAVCGALAVAAVVALMRWSDRRDARHAVGRPYLITREIPGVSPTALPPAGRHVTAPTFVLNFYGADSSDMAARVIRNAIPERCGKAITGTEE